MSKRKTPSNKHIASNAFHIILSPKECVDISRLVAFFERRDCFYVCSYEYGTNGHKHIDAYVVYTSSFRQDHYRRDLLKLYPEIPNSELINVKVKRNHIDPNPLYGYGYSLKEQGEIYTNLSYEQQIDALEYYESHKDIVSQQQESFRHTTGNMSVDDIFDGLVGFATSYLKDQRQPIKYIDRSHFFLVDAYFQFLLKNKLAKFSTIHRIRKESIFENLSLVLGADLLTAPNTYIPTSINLSEVHPMLQ